MDSTGYFTFDLCVYNRPWHIAIPTACPSLIHPWRIYSPSSRLRNTRILCCFMPGLHHAKLVLFLSWWGDNIRALKYKGYEWSVLYWDEISFVFVAVQIVCDPCLLKGQPNIYACNMSIFGIINNPERVLTDVLVGSNTRPIYMSGLWTDFLSNRWQIVDFLFLGHYLCIVHLPLCRVWPLLTQRAPRGPSYRRQI